MTTIGLSILCVLFWLVVGILPLAGLLYLAYFIVSLPLRRQEQGRFLLQLIESGLKQGRTPEDVVTGISATQERSLGDKFHLLAAHIRSGLRLGQALERVPRLLPPQVTAMLKVGEEIGDIRKVLPACRGLLTDGNSQTRSAMNYLLILALFAIPIPPILTLIANRKIAPKFIEIFNGALGGGAHLPWHNFFRIAFFLACAQIILALLINICAVAYIAGPRSWKWINSAVFPMGDWILFHLPWRKKRMQRDFSSMLALLLDAEVPEYKALQLAAESTGNRLFINKSVRAIADLKSGVPITEAVSRMDDSGEFKWRLKTAVHNHSGFRAALSGWHEALDAKAFQQEQSAAHLVTTFVVLFNGVIVALFLIGSFSLLTMLMNAGTLW